MLSPARSLAQEVPGIDLSQPPAEEPAQQPPSEPEEQPPMDLSQPPASREPAAAAEKEKGKEGRPLLPFGDEDVALGDRVKAVQRKGFLKRGRLELTPMFSATVNDAFYQKFGGGLRLAYNVQDSFAIAVRGTYYEPLRTDNVREGKIAFQSQLLTSQLDGQVMVDGVWSPIYGKASFLGSSILHFDLFLAGGFGVVWSATSGEPRNEGPHLATDLGGGVRFYPKEWLAFELGLMATLYPDQPILSVPGTVQKVFVANVGLSFFFPPRFEYVYP
ncbi:outer membrane beta-barrel domain-containing protein [Anaeromyxobacter sp. Fw109-5]|uniref:outer membrane beta-barrel domain-containing protein n=1 Tax=Anaeromyxobacter sp. (strain Fw109-5) TaxID=404589 RepID=UPI001F16809A|nr:outer membrane beta-barrel domain-containing protein [Anaeromyxobacter sp. Fw109-5]